VLLRALICISLLPVCLVAFCPATAASESPDKPTGKVVVTRIQFQTPVPLTPSEHQKLIKDLRKTSWKLWQEQTYGFTKDTAEELTREMYQDKGYFKAQASAEFNGVRARHSKNAVALVLTVAPGRQYHLTNIVWKGVTLFPEYQLEKLIPINPGQLFNRSTIAKGLEAARDLYSSQGYINFTCVPMPQADDEGGTVAFVIDVDEGRQFRFGELEVEGMQSKHRQILLSAWDGLRGRPYSPEDANKFFNRFFSSPLPNITPGDYTVRNIDGRKNLVNYVLRLTPTCATVKECYSQFDTERTSKY
jgi:outer membrane translocation and assembly module TamA